MWSRLDDQFWSDPKVEKAGNEAVGAFCRMLSYCGDQLTDGVVTAGVAGFIARPKTIDRLAEFGFIVERGEDWLIPNYLEFNPPKTEVEARREARAEAGRIGGLKSRPPKQNGSGVEANA